jgi:hypothetical protein
MVIPRIEFGQVTPNGGAFFISGDRFLALADFTIHISDAIQDTRLVVPPLRVARVDPG